MRRRALITGGAGFIGSHVCDQLISNGYEVRIFDNLNPQVHGRGRKKPRYLDARAEFVLGDVRDPAETRRALAGVDCVVHLAAAVGVGQSMYQIREYTEVNNMGTAVLLEEISKLRIQRLIVASSMSIYGEGRYRDNAGGIHDGVTRSIDELKQGRWDPVVGVGDSGSLQPVPTPEEKRPALSSVYALSKYDQEQLCLMIGRAYGVPTVALRFFNAYGPRQALSNPYTGVLAIFASRILNGKRPLVFEDGEQLRDFVSVHDVARACRLALESDRAVFRAINVGSGQARGIAELAGKLAQVLGRPELVPEITHKYRVGDIRHCFADIELASEVLGYSPQMSLEAGMLELGRFLQTETSVDRTDAARSELESRGLTL